MYEIVHGTTHDLADVAAFLTSLRTLEHHPRPEVRRLFDAQAEVIVARAPGRLDVMGGIADYSGSLVLELPIREATLVALQRDPMRRLQVVSLLEGAERDTKVDMSLADFEEAGQPVEYSVARALFQRHPARHWASYVAGVFLVLMRERGARFADGARILIDSRVPEGKGVSSSAALEVATMQAVAAAYDIRLEPREMALLCQMVENLVVGAPCGVMDQMTTACGQSDHLLALLCQPAEWCGTVAIPAEISFWGVDSGVRHAVTGADYGSVRVGAFMGYRIIAELAGLVVQSNEAGEPLQIQDPLWHGYLANLTPSQFAEDYTAQLPERITGKGFLQRYGGTTDAVTRVDPEQSYAVRVPTTHAVYEHHRVRLFAELLAGPAESERRLEVLGELMYQSHASYSACGLGSAGTDQLVSLVREAGPTRGLYGARITGGGSGGTVAILGRREAAESVHEVASRYAEASDYQPYIFSGSSPGSSTFGTLRLRKP